MSDAEMASITADPFQVLKTANAVLLARSNFIPPRMAGNVIDAAEDVPVANAVTVDQAKKRWPTQRRELTTKPT
jgi:hypothetical protein